MQNTAISPQGVPTGYIRTNDTPAIAWSAVIGGAVAAVSLSLIMVILGSGLGLAVRQPFSHMETSPLGVTSAVVIWLVLTQWIASALGGYFAGRLRSKHLAVHDDEAFFRDTAHGFLAWAVATLVTAALFFSAMTAGAGGAMHMAAPKPPGGPAGGPHGGAVEWSAIPTGGPIEAHMYLVDSLFRSEHPAPSSPTDMEVRGEASLILLNGMKDGDVPQADRGYLASLVAAQSGIPLQEATARVDSVVAEMQHQRETMKKDAETARKAGSTLSIFTFLSMLVGAFVASVAGALGGKRRDEYAL